MKTIWLVVPCYNEEEVLPETSRQLKAVMNSMIEKGKISPESKITFVNDGSKDGTWDIISSLCAEDSLFAGINLSRNRGHQNALLAGLAAMGVEIVFNHADYRLMSRRALEALSEFEEVNLFLRGIVPQIGFKTSTVEYERKERLAGESKYPLKKMISFAFEGITSFSVKPLKMATTLGIFSLIVCFAMIIYCIVSKATGHAVAGWASIGASIWALGGLQLFMLGVIGEYIGKIYIETKHRPKYIIESIILDREKLEK